MEIIQIVGLGMVSTIMILLLKAKRPDMAISLAVITGVIIFFIVIFKIQGVVNIIEKYIEKSNINMFYVNILLKIIGISYIAEFGAEICRDAGAGSIASKIELSGKIIIITLSIPIITSLLEMILKISI